jgi:putative RNA 2'-phosphotransferase
MKKNKIRANQGHSISIDLALEPQMPPDELYHGTATRFLTSIMESGIKPMSRQYVHLSRTAEIAETVGKRHGKPVVLKINTKAMYEKGHTFYFPCARFKTTAFRRSAFSLTRGWMT